MKKVKLTPDAQAVIYGFICVLAACMLVFCSFCFSSCTNNAKANIPENEIMKLRQDTAQQAAILRAYNHLLHRIWLDKPNYVEDALVECDEFIDLAELLNDEWEDTFSFYDKCDSLTYHINWFAEDSDCVIHVVKYVVNELKVQVRNIRVCK